MPDKLATYQSEASTTAVYPARGRHNLEALTYCTLGLANEAGELAGKVKKVHRGDMPLVDAEDAILDEAGDILWYLAQLCTEMGVTLEEVARRNLGKLLDRQQRNVIRGSGDRR